jgi:hypothetical protein
LVDDVQCLGIEDDDVPGRVIIAVTVYFWNIPVDQPVCGNPLALLDSIRGCGAVAGETIEVDLPDDLVGIGRDEVDIGIR